MQINELEIRGHNLMFFIKNFRLSHFWGVPALWDPLGSSGKTKNIKNNRNKRFSAIFDQFFEVFAPNYMYLCLMDMETIFSDKIYGF